MKVEIPEPLAPIPELTAALMRQLLDAVSLCRALLHVAAPWVRKGRMEIIGANGKVVGWLGTGERFNAEECSLEIRDPVTGREIILRPTAPAVAAAKSSDNPMLAPSTKGLPDPSERQIDEIRGLGESLDLSDEALAAVLLRYKVRGGVESIPDCHTANRILGHLHALAKSKGRKVGTDDPLLGKAREVIQQSGRGSVSLLQRELRIGYQRAGRMMAALEARGVVGPFEGCRERRVLPCGAV